METSILRTIKKNIGTDPDYEVFDPDIIMHINAVFLTLNDLGLGPAEGFQIEDDNAKWDDFMQGVAVNAVKTYMSLSVRMLFDPPQQSWTVDAMQKQIAELEWRMMNRAEYAPVVIL